MIRSGRVSGHRAMMTGAFVSSCLFLVSYLVYHFRVGSVRFHGQGPVRALYFALLLTHTVLAVANLPLILRTLHLARRGRYAEHRRIARWTWPIWMYVSLSGVLVYLLLYRL